MELGEKTGKGVREVNPRSEDTMKPDKAVWLLALLLAVSLLIPAPAGAEAKHGFSLFLQGGHLDLKDEATTQEYGNLGSGAGLDYQYAFTRQVSFLAFVSEVSGKVSFPTLPDVTVAKISHLGVQARLWLGAMFMGIHTGSYILTTAESSFSFDMSNGAAGSGAIFGYESDRGWFMTLQNDSARNLQVNNGPLVHMDGFRFSLGYRWK